MEESEIQLYVSQPSWRCWRTRRLLKRKGYRFEVLDATDDAVLRSWLAHFEGRQTMPYVFVAHRPVGGLREIRGLESSGELDRLVCGEV